MKDLGFLRYFLSIEVAYSSSGYLLSQKKYISDILPRSTHHDSIVSDLLPATLPWSCTSSFDMMAGHLFHILSATKSLWVTYLPRCYQTIYLPGCSGP